jgi:hypothetical protein
MEEHDALLTTFFMLLNPEMEALCSSETSVAFQVATRRYIPADENLNAVLNTASGTDKQLHAPVPSLPVLIAQVT